jgi:hypothetical protein
MTTPAVTTRAFICRDCGWDCVSFGEPHANDQDICQQCQWLREIEDPQERAKLRKWMYDRRG